MSNEPNKVIYSMIGVSKSYDKKVVLKDIYLSYFYGAKIGVLGLNGSGKSSLLKILAGVDKNFEGQISLSPGYTVGYLEQEPHLDEAKTVRQVVEEGVQETVDLLKEFERINEKFAEPMDDAQMNKLLERQGEVQEKLDHLNAWDLDSQLEMAMDALRCPPGDALDQGAQRRREAPRRAVPAAAAEARRADPRRADQPPRRRVGRLAGAAPASGTRGRSSPSPTTATSSTTSPAGSSSSTAAQGIPWKGNYSSWLEQKQARLAIEEKTGIRPAEGARSTSWNGSASRPRPARPRARRASPPTRTLLNQDVEEEGAGDRDLHPARARGSGKLVIEAAKVTKAYGDKLLMQDLSFSLPPGGIVGIIGPNGAGKTTLFRMITGQEKPDAGTFKVGDSVKLAYVEQSRDVLAGRADHLGSHQRRAGRSSSSAARR